MFLVGVGYVNITTGIYLKSVQQKSALPQTRFGKDDSPVPSNTSGSSTSGLDRGGAVREQQPEIKQEMLVPPTLDKETPTQQKQKKKLSWIAKWMIGTAVLGGAISYTNQPPGPLDQVYLQSEEVRHQGKKMDWDAIAIENDVKILQESLDQVDRFQNLGFRAEARQFFADAAKTYQESTKRLADIQATVPKSTEQFTALQKSIEKLDKADQDKVLRYLRESEWSSKTMPEYWERDSQKHLGTMNSAMGFAYNYTLTSPPLQAGTPQEIASGTRFALEAIQDSAKQLSEELTAAQKEYNTAEDRFSYNREHYWESQKDHPNLPKHRPYVFGVDRYGDRVFHFERDMIKQEYKLKALAQRLAITEKAYQMMLERAKMDPLLKDQLPQLEKGLKVVQQLNKESQSQASAVRLKNMYHRLQSDSVENRPVTLQAKQRAEEVREGW
jgi:hypothetical protein